MKFTPIQITLKNGKTVEIREARTDDAEKLIKTAKSILRTSAYMCSYDNEFNPAFEDEQEWVNIHNHTNSLLLVTIYEGEILSIFNATGFRNQKMKHVAVLGISVIENWRGQGLGNILFEQLIKWAKSNPELEILALDVFSGNTKAIDLYKRHGFIIDGTRKNYYKESTGKYNDNVFMSLNVK